MLFRSRHHKRYLLGLIAGATILLIFNAQLQVMTFEKRYTIEIIKMSTPYVVRHDDVEHTENVTNIFERENLAADDQNIISFIQNLIHTDALREGAYNLTDPKREDRSRGRARDLDAYFQKKLAGFFVEIGAGDGESQSPTLMLERDRQWNGLLIEPDPEKYKEMLEKGRTSQLLNACVKTNKTHHSLEFIGDSETSRTPCFWIESILLANGVTKIDVLSIDVNGKEVDILKSFPFEKFPVSAVTVELHGKFAKTTEIMHFMKENDFKSLKLMGNHILDKTDILFVSNTGHL